jgi:hypothetical protein
MLTEDKVFMKASSQTIQVKLTLDEGLRNIWDTLSKEYEGLDKSGIVRLALNNLAKAVKRHESERLQVEMGKFLDELDKKTEGPTEREFAEWWNKNKRDLV